MFVEGRASAPVCNDGILPAKPPGRRRYLRLSFRPSRGGFQFVIPTEPERTRRRPRNLLFLPDRLHQPNQLPQSPFSYASQQLAMKLSDRFINLTQ